MSEWVADVIDRTTRGLRPLGNPERAVEMRRYMKDVAPFLGINASERRVALKSAWKGLEQPSSDELGETALELMACAEREYHYAAYDLIERFRRNADDLFLEHYVTTLLTTTSWWDTVDGLVSAAVSPLCRVSDQSVLIDQWSESGDMWLIRSAVTHQRAWKTATDVPRILRLCDRHWGNREFFVAKGIGWAMRDIARLYPLDVIEFLESHPDSNPIATREARRAISASA